MQLPNRCCLFSPLSGRLDPMRPLGLDNYPISSAPDGCLRSGATFHEVLTALSAEWLARVIASAEGGPIEDPRPDIAC
jgi:hypothetical protein